MFDAGHCGIIENILRMVSLIDLLGVLNAGDTARGK
jgi:hypothetical protein